MRVAVAVIMAIRHSLLPERLMSVSLPLILFLIELYIRRLSYHQFLTVFSDRTTRTRPPFLFLSRRGFLVSHIMISVKHTEAGERRRLCWFLLHLEDCAWCEWLFLIIFTKTQIYRLDMKNKAA